ncbi:hypothetical protein U8335_12835 [Roseiconus lacunae]|uniref:hypothetical protein n=1 Tax=Roseiconus lacunae TaxID=2605694 RepID=UPI00308DBBD7|nr:hypothetical protein U8335_12835 [Stieleria sp. HD01]
MSILRAVGRDQETQRARYLDRFCQTYTTPLVRFLIVTGKAAQEEAVEIVQDFWLKKILEPKPESNLIAKYLEFVVKNPDASFRRYLARSLSNHCISLYQGPDEQRRRRSIPIEKTAELAVESQHEFEFDVIWANHLLQTVLESVRSECFRKGHETKWMIFVALVLRPNLMDCEAESYRVIAQRLQIGNPKEIGNGWITVKRMFHRHFELAIRDYVPSPTANGNAQASKREVEEVMLYLAKAGKLQIQLPEIDNQEVSLTGRSRFDLNIDPRVSLYSDESDLKNLWGDLADLPLADWLQFDHASALLSVRQLISAPEPSLDFLRLVHRQAKVIGRMKTSEMVLPPKIFGAIYLIAISLAKQHHGVNLSSSAPKRLSRQMAKYAKVTWIDEDARKVLLSGSQMLKTA